MAFVAISILEKDADSKHSLKDMKWIEHTMLGYSVEFYRLNIATANLKTHERTINLTYHGFANSEQPKNSLFKRVVPLWNALPEKLKLGNQTYGKCEEEVENVF